MTLNEQTEKRVYEKLRAFDGLELSGNSPVDSSIASVLSQGEVLADNGEQYSKIQDAIDNSEGWTFVGPGTYYENVVIDKDDFTLQGAGYDTLIDGGTTGHGIYASSNNVTLQNISVNTSGSSTSYNSIDIDGDKGVVKDVTIRAAGNDGVSVDGVGCIVDNVTIETASDFGISTEDESIVTNCSVIEWGTSSYDFSDGIQVGSDSIVSNCIVKDGQSEDGIQPFGDDSIIIGCRVINASRDGIHVGSGGNDNIIANNRVSGSAQDDIENVGSGTLIEGNLTGSAN